MFVSNPIVVEEKVKQYEKQGCVACFAVCKLCGEAKWMRPRKPKEGEQVGKAVFEEYSTTNSRAACLFCHEFARRFPDVFNWVSQVVAYQRMRELGTR